MNPEFLPLLFVYVGGALSISFLCSVLEATLLSARPTELVQRKESGDAGAELLLDLKEKRMDDAISAILTLNTIAHTIGASLAGAQAAKVWSDDAVGIFSAVLTILVLVVTEIIPKTIGTAYASQLVGFVARTINFLTRILTPILIITRVLTRMLSNKEEHTVSPREVEALVSVAHRQGQLEGDVRQAVSNLLRFDEVRVEDIMTPRTVTWMMPAEATIEELLKAPEAQIYSRLPLYEGSRDQIVGYILVRQALLDAALGGPGDRALKEHLREIHYVSENLPVGELLRSLLQWREHMALVTDEFGGISGLVTMEDAVETILGQEILDEMDRVADMRVMAIQLRDRRLGRHREAVLVPPQTVTDSDTEADPAAASAEANEDD